MLTHPLRACLLCGAVVALQLAAACVEPEVAAVTSTSASVVTTERDRARSSIPSGTRVAVSLDEDIDTASARIGQDVTARAVASIRAPDGTIVVRKGAIVRGRLVSIGTRESPALRLELDTIDTTAGPVPIQASIRRARTLQYLPADLPRAQQRDWSCASQRPEDPRCESYSRLVEGDRDIYADHKYGESPPADSRPLELQLRRGTLVDLILTRPLALPAPLPTRTAARPR